MTTTPHIPCHVIAGPLGVGKTSAILHYLRQHASRQRVGVLVNDFGPVGLDGATLAAEAPQTRVLNVPGGCICCTMLAELPGCIRRLISEQTLDRLIIEPSGMASPAQVIDLLRHNQRELRIDLRPTIAMLSVTDFDEETFERMAYYHLFCEAADVLVFNRCDQASESRITRAQQWGGKLDPSKLRVLTTSHGQLPAEVFDLMQGTCNRAHHHDDLDDHDHDHDHDQSHAHGPGIHTGGIVFDAGQSFDEQVLLVNLIRVCHQGIAENEVLRLKGVFHTNTGWHAIEIANRRVSSRPSAHRRDSRMEWLTQPGIVDQTTMLEEIGRPVDWQEIAQIVD